MITMENPEENPGAELERCPKCGSCMYQEDGKLKCSFILCGHEVELPSEGEGDGETEV